VGLLENADYVALDVAITVHVRGLQTGPVLVENQRFRIRQIILSDGRSSTDFATSDVEAIPSASNAGARGAAMALSRGRAASRLEQMTDAPSWSRTLPPRCFGSPLRMGLLQIDSQSALHIGVSAGVGAVAPALSIVGPELRLPRGFGAGARGERGSGRCQEQDAEHTDISPSNLRRRLPWVHGRS
jgi:hypothetical protein